MTEKIDSHVHFWKIAQYDSGWMKDGYEPLAGDRLPSDLAPRLEAAGIDGAIFVQAQHVESDNEMVLEWARQHDWLRGVVGWVDLTRDDVEARLERYRDEPLFVGIRHLTHNEPDDDWLLRDDVGRGLEAVQRAGLPFDLLFFPRHLPHGATIAKRHPELTFVIDHLSKPHIKAGTVDDWLPALRAAAEQPNVHAKLSGLVTEADWQHWSVDGLRRYVDLALECFGPQRLILGSDWPVCEVVAHYTEVVDGLRATIDSLSDSERAAIEGGNAQRIYRLPPPS